MPRISRGSDVGLSTGQRTGTLDVPTEHEEPTEVEGAELDHPSWVPQAAVLVQVTYLLSRGKCQS